MRVGMWVKAAVVVGGAVGGGVAWGQVTRVATFENYAEPVTFKPSFVDPLSGIRFYDSTHFNRGFVVEYAEELFGGGNYLTAGGFVPGPGGFLGANFAFTADLPEPAIRVGLDMETGYLPMNGTLVRAYDAAGRVVAEEVAPVTFRGAYHFELVSGGYDIVRFRVVVPFTNPPDGGYDNVSYTVLPEPGVAGVGVGMVVGGVVMGRGRRGTGG